MAKMMMGQIDHARMRVNELKAKKFGDKPKAPVIFGGSKVRNQVRDGALKVTAAQLKRAFEAYMNKVPGKTIGKENGNYKNNYITTYNITTCAASSVEDALAVIVYARENNAEIVRYQTEKELFDVRSEAINLKATEVEDAIVLGDQHAALVALQEFAAFEV